MSIAVANQYAKALLGAVSASGSGLDPEETLRQIDDFAAALASSPELRNALHSPAVAPAQKRNVVARLAAAAGAHPLVRNFLSLVVRKGRLGMLPEIRERFRVQLDETLGLVRAHVVSAQSLSDAGRTALESELARMAGKAVRCDYVQDAALVGGVTVNMGAKVFDGSVRGQLAALRRRLVGEV